MIYEGNLYGRIGRKYFDTGKTSEDWDRLVNALQAAILCIDTDYYIISDKERQNTLQKCKDALESINIKL